MISEEDIEKSVDYLRDSAIPAAKARAELIYMEQYRKTVKAQIMAEHASKPLVAQEREAYKDKRYLDVLDAIKAAAFNDSRCRFLREAAEAKISAWQTLSANYRGIKV